MFYNSDAKLLKNMWTSKLFRIIISLFFMVFTINYNG